MMACDTTSIIKRNTTHANKVAEVDKLSSDDDLGNKRSTLRDVARRDDNFYNSSRTLAYATFPEVDATLRKYKCRNALNDPDVNI